MFSIIALGIFFILAPIDMGLVWMLIWTIVGMIYYGIYWLLAQLKLKAHMGKYDLIVFNLYAILGVSFWKYRCCDADLTPLRYMIGGSWFIIGLVVLFATNQLWIMNFDHVVHPDELPNH